MKRIVPLAVVVFLTACSSFTESEDKPDAADSPDAHVTADTRITDSTADVMEQDAPVGACPAGLAQPSIQSFAITDGITQVVLEQSISLSVQATGEPGQTLSYAFEVSPPGDTVENNHDGTGQWQLSTAKPVFFTTEFTITANVGYACQGGPTSNASVRVSVLGNVLVAERKHAAIEAVGSNGKPLGQVAGPVVLTHPSDLLLLSASELAVADLSAKLVKILDLTSGAVLRSFGSEVTDLEPRFLDLLPSGEVLVGFAGNEFFRYSKQGQLLQTLTSPHPYTNSGLTHQSDGSIIAGISGSGAQYRFAPDGTSLGLFTDPADTADTNSLLGISGDEVLLGLRNGMNDGLLVRVSKTGTVIESTPPQFGKSYYYLRAFVDGYLFVDFYENKIYRLDQDLTEHATPFATLPMDTALAGMVWLHDPPQ